jgi:hypothetical protein
VGLAVGDGVGAGVGARVGDAVGDAVGASVGFAVGAAVGVAVGAVGVAVGGAVGASVGVRVGVSVGGAVGGAVGVDGAAVGDRVGAATGVPLVPAIMKTKTNVRNTAQFIIVSRTPLKLCPKGFFRRRTSLWRKSCGTVSTSKPAESFAVILSRYGASLRVLETWAHTIQSHLCVRDPTKLFEQAAQHFIQGPLHFATLNMVVYNFKVRYCET